MNTRTILVVDDDPDIQMLFGMHLKQAGYKTWSACDGLSCIGAARRERPDLILLDLGLPAGDGEMALRTLRALPQFDRTPILVVSGREHETWATRVQALGANGFVQKPVTPERLLAEVRRLLHEPTPAPVRLEPAPGPARTEPALPRRTSQQLELSCPQCGAAVAELSATLAPSSLRAILRACTAGSAGAGASPE